MDKCVYQNKTSIRRKQPPQLSPVVQSTSEGPNARRDVEEAEDALVEALVSLLIGSRTQMGNMLTEQQPMPPRRLQKGLYASVRGKGNPTVPDLIGGQFPGKPPKRASTLHGVPTCSLERSLERLRTLRFNSLKRCRVHQKPRGSH